MSFSVIKTPCSLEKVNGLPQYFTSSQSRTELDGFRFMKIYEATAIVCYFCVPQEEKIEILFWTFFYFFLPVKLYLLIA